MTDRTLVKVARGVFALGMLFLVGIVVAAFLLVQQGAQTPRDIVPDLILLFGTTSFAVVGVVVANRQPRNAVGWILLGVGLSWLFSGALDVYTTWGLEHPATAPGYRTGAVISSAFWIPGLGPLGTFVILLFPDGRLPTPRWRWWSWFCGSVLLLAYLAIIFSPGPIEGTDGLVNPLGITVLGYLEPLFIGFILAIPACIVGCAIALVRRFRRSRGVQRLQLKWLAFAGAVTAAVYLVAMMASIPYPWGEGAATPTWVTVVQNASLLAFLLLPLAIGIAITRHRLYDIDRLINRTLVYGAVSAFLIAVYLGLVFGLGGAVRAVTGQEQNNLAVAASTLAVAALFRPARARVQRFIDRRFYRRKYDAMRTVESFSARLRQETDLTTLTQDLRAVVSETVQPARVSVWIAAAPK